MNYLLKTLLGASLCSLMLSSCAGQGGDAANAETKKVDYVSPYTYPEGSPVAKHGMLRVEGLQMVDQQGEAVQLAGFSTMGWQWCADCYTRESIKNLVDKWHINVLRLAMYVEEGGYNDHPEPTREKIGRAHV